jgi:hypothetical protein
MVHVECVPNTDPEFYGCWLPVAKGFPVCTATVDYPALGYRSLFGWVQVVRSTDNESGGLRFELDHSGCSAMHLRLGPTAVAGQERNSGYLGLSPRICVASAHQRDGTGHRGGHDFLLVSRRTANTSASSILEAPAAGYWPIPATKSMVVWGQLAS